jgi:hypothetical protein
MNYKDFRRIVSSFADTPADIDIQKQRLLVQIREEVIEATVIQRQGEIWVTEDDSTMPGFQWIIKRIAKIDLLADRIKQYIPENPTFVTPIGSRLDQRSEESGSTNNLASDAAAACVDMLGTGHAGYTNVVYLTSDAGEGKSTLIAELAHRQAKLYKEKKANWLLVPITLGGRSFLRFDDVILGAVVGKLRFPYVYYESFLELIKLGVIVPAFDGFEEMFVESTSGEGISAIGNLIRSLESSGSVLISARKAFFDYMGLRTQAQLFDSLGGFDVTFSRLALQRWTRAQFVEYAGKAGYEYPEKIYEDVEDVVGKGHPLLSRAVLVKNLLSVSSALGSREALLEKLRSSPEDYFFSFVDAIVQREANEKWIDRSGEPHKPLIPIADHHELLSEVAAEMWRSSSDTIKSEVLDLIAELFAEEKKYTPLIARQIKERIKQHPLLNSFSSRGASYGFDHEEFKSFFLGEQLGKLITKGVEPGCRAIVQRGVLPRPSIAASVSYLTRNKADLKSVFKMFSEIIATEGPISYAREALGDIAIGLLVNGVTKGGELANYTISTDMLSGGKLIGATFADCYFQSQDLESTKIEKCVFNGCRFERLYIHSSTDISYVTLEDCIIDGLYMDGVETGIFDPRQIAVKLRHAGFKVVEANDNVSPQTEALEDPEEDLVLTQRLLRHFIRSTFLPEVIIRVRLGQRANHFMTNILPILLRNGVLVEATYSGSGTQSGYKLGVSMGRIVDSLTKCGGKLEKFVSAI